MLPLGFIGLQLRELEKVRSHGVNSLGGTTERDSQYRSKSRSAHKLRKLHGHGHNVSQQHPHHPEKKTSTARPISMITLSDGSMSSLSCTTTSASNSSNSSSEQRSSASSTASSSAFLGPNGKFDLLNVLLSAVFTGGSLQHAAPRRRVSNDASTTPVAKAKFGSTATLTEGGGGSVNGDDDEESEVERVASSSHYWYANDGGEGEADNGSVGSNGDYNSDIDENDDEWPERVLEVAGVLPSEKAEVVDIRSRPPLPPIEHNGKIGQIPQHAPQSSEEAPPLLQTSSTPSSKMRFPVQPTQFEYTFRRHIHRRPHAHQLSSQHITDKCQRDLYICLLQLLANLTEEPIAMLLRSLSDAERADFLKLLTYVV
ncbi:unnamed protein product [Hydatigera taeniaeformis]|uniref:GRIP domain-containing protein n=1 Tax=Hydatigena taeniaeformis TaxID=6205 RepID=A0A0R3WQS0_HYDTA|nr:unnamed protein product [Hydatigera taeniaeformis]